MLTVEESKKYLEKFNLTDEQVEQFRNSAYSIINDILDQLYETKTDN
jgi:hypothetical protein